MKNKNKLLLLSATFGLFLYGCNCDQEVNYSLNEETVRSNTNQKDLASATRDNCVQTEGDYLTIHYCININNIRGELGEYPIAMRIDKLDNRRKVNHITAVGKWALYPEPNEDKQYGYKALAGDRYYEIDWSKSTTYFRIWNKDRTKLIEEEPVIKGPESLVKE